MHAAYFPTVGFCAKPFSARCLWSPAYGLTDVTRWIRDTGWSG
jgi:hypothetical protein